MSLAPFNSGAADMSRDEKRRDRWCLGQGGLPVALNAQGRSALATRSEIPRGPLVAAGVRASG